MKLPDDRGRNRIPLIAALAVTLAACSASPRPPLTADIAPQPPGAGPQADYPIVVGPAYSVAGTTFTPEDVLNYDQVGVLAADVGAGVTAAHHTLPLPSYVEVTSLDSGRTVLVRVERRGPMAGTELLALSPAALAQLDAHAGTPVRVRRVNPPEDQRALLRAGQSAPLRMDTPMSLVEVLKRKLPGSAPAVAPVAVAAKSDASADVSSAHVASVAAKIDVAAAKSDVRATSVPALPPLATRAPQPIAVSPSARFAEAFTPAVKSAAALAAPKPAVSQKPAPAAKPAAPATAASKYEVQAAAFASADNARRAAGKLGGKVSAAGALFRVRTGPFATRGEAEASLAKVRAAGYSDARIQTSG